MFTTCFYYGNDRSNFNQTADRILSINSSAKIVRFNNIFHLLTSLRCYEHFIEKTKESFPSHIFIDELPGSINYLNFIAAFDRLRLENHKVYELSVIPIFTKASAAGDRSSVLELEYVYQYIESNNFEIYDNTSNQTYLN